MKRPTLATILILLSTGVLLVAFFQAMEWDFGESIRFTLGITLLWGPVLLLFYLLLEREVEDRVTRFTFSAIASYAITALTFTGFAELHLDILFYVCQAVIVVICVTGIIRRKSWQSIGGLLTRSWRHSAILLFVLAGSMFTSIEYDKAISTAPDGTKTFLLGPDVLYAIGQSYQLARGIPLQQSPIRAGTPERAYHFLSHITTMLIARYTGQGDMLRAQTAYHYMIISVLMLLAIFSIVKTLTKSRWAGYLAIAFVYIITSWSPPLTPSTFPYFYFTALPNVVNGLDVANSEPQMYSGIVVMFGGLLGLLLITNWGRRAAPRYVLLIGTGLIMAASIRFRIHFGMIMLPGFVLILVALGLRRRQWFYFGVIGLTALVAVLLYLETTLPVYFPSTSALQFGYNELTAPGKGYNNFYGSWPGASDVRQWIAQTFTNPETFKWVWQYVDLTSFTIINIVGIPLLLATITYLLSRTALRKFAWFSLYIVLLVIGSVVASGAVILVWDPYSLAGQIPFHVRWYLFPLGAVALWLLYRRGIMFVYRHKLIDKQYVYWSRRVLPICGFALIAGFVIEHSNLPPNSVEFIHQNYGFVMDTDLQAALAYIHDQTPPDAVILSRVYQENYVFPVSGIGGRASWEEVEGNQLDLYAQLIYPDDRRFERILAIWSATDSPTMCKLLLSTSATYVLDYKIEPFAIKDPTCMRVAWTSPNQNNTIWQVIR